MQAWRLFAIFAGGDRLGRRRRAADPDRVGARGRGRGADRPAAAGEGVRGFRQRHDPPHRPGVSGRACRRQVRPRRRGIGHLIVSRFGRSTLGLSYSIFLVDGLIAPAFPSNTARSGVIYPLAFSLADAAGATPGRRQPPARSARFLMFSGIVSLSLSSALWLTAMAANPLGDGDRADVRRRDRLRLVAARRLACRRWRRWSLMPLAAATGSSRPK